MIVLDSSVLVGIIKGEADAEALLDLLASEECTIGAPTLVETRAWCLVNLAARASGWLEDFIESERGAVVPFTREMADAASAAFARFGRGSGHPAKLNFGDCLAYAASSVLGAPLLFKGGDFGWTDVMVHPASIRL
ncbi:MAG TPA: type II toxin-antitoxin system VapC family toxin [Stellaceae bacterium]|nr:type II toxin-antitoxin system VapC family toxin [Stellaceae bacterium]